MRNRQIGSASSAEAQLLYDIAKKLDKISKILLAIKDGGSPTLTTTTTLP